LETDKTACIQGIVESVKMIRVWKRHMTIIEAIIKDDTGTVKAVWFNQPYLIGTFKKGTAVCLAGKLVDKKGAKYLSNPMYEKSATITKAKRTTPIRAGWYRYTRKPRGFEPLAALHHKTAVIRLFGITRSSAGKHSGY